MEQSHKRLKITKESVIDDITSSIPKVVPCLLLETSASLLAFKSEVCYVMQYEHLGDISTSVTSISESYRTLLKANKAVVLYCQSVDKRLRETTLDQLQTDLEQTRIEQE